MVIGGGLKLLSKEMDLNITPAKLILVHKVKVHVATMILNSASVIFCPPNVIFWTPNVISKTPNAIFGHPRYNSGQCFQ